MSFGFSALQHLGLSSRRGVVMVCGMSLPHQLTTQVDTTRRHLI